MSKRTKKPAESSASSRPERRRGERRAPGSASAITMSIIGVGLRELYLKALPQDPTAPPRVLGQMIPNASMEMRGGLEFLDAETAAMSMEAIVRDADPRPLVELTLTITAFFRFGEGIPRRLIASQLSRMGGPMIFPYLRETVHSTMARSIYGQIILPPTIIQPLLSDEQLSSIPE